MITIPIFVTAGNHDTNRGKNYEYYSRYKGNTKSNSITSLNDFNFVGINYVDKTLATKEFAKLRQAMANSSHTFTIIATHYYMNKDGTLSVLGKDIDRELTGQPALVLAGHMHGDCIRVKTINGNPVIEDLTNYQDGNPDGPTGKNYSAGTLYTVNAVDGRIVQLTSETIRIFPAQSFDSEKVIYDTTQEFSGDNRTAVPGSSVPVKKQPVVISTKPVGTARGDLDYQFHVSRP